MPMLWRVSNRYSARATLSVGVSVIGLLSLSAALATWQETPIIGVVPILACALMVTLFVVVRRALRKASAQLDTIMREELGAGRAVPMHSADPSKLGL
jgi:CHASE2 domain-containing sensor protein